MSSSTSTPAKPQFMLLLRQPPGPPPPPEFLGPVMEKFGRWMAEMAAQGAVVGTNGLGHTGRVLRGSGGSILTDGPYAEGKEIVGGYLIVQADNLDAATALARNCPGLDYGLAVEVRPIVQPEKS